MPPELIVLDVAHGNCTLVTGQDTTVVIDAPRGGLHIDALKERSIRKVHAVIVSHADADHMGGVAHLLYDEDVQVHSVYVNADATKTAQGGGAVWQNFVRALADAVERGEVKSFGIKRGSIIELNDRLIHLEVLAPSTDLVLLAAGGRDQERRLKSNTLSVVIRVLFGDRPLALLTGDLDQTGLESLLGGNDDLHAKALVFPHHGGRSGGDDRAFASAITEAVEPEIVIFSIGREMRYPNPRPEIVAGVLAAKPDVAIMCTQLSKRCSPVTFDPLHLAPLPAKGMYQGNCCAGSLQFDPHGLVAPSAEAHAEFIDNFTTSPLCRQE